MDKSGIIGEISESLGGVVKQTAKQVSKTPVDLTKTAASQITGQDAGVPESLNSAVKPIQNIQKPKRSPQEKVEQEIKDKASLEKARSELHSLYYQGLVNPQKQEEERVAEKLEREDKQKEFEDMQANSKKPQNLPQNVKQGTGEKVVGIAG